ncbi:hypothetical protein P170DRAFT_282013 [Aspergillus steynii IBT 23096]|uniref:Uncharacterized protein n=1 Tax=Aspergillus steynii IBT 23096 TaxID=1392250 RepID=A0A2I2FUB9_9EURO|nr:uncharacterized protein P170DRAFT_282013 [Aspergillus steynii IBT 23096]PLB44239.1 hypothetical protein P170DRAFT_282013 [Aspergillus steynii IBT 23096]
MQFDLPPSFRARIQRPALLTMDTKRQEVHDDIIRIQKCLEDHQERFIQKKQLRKLGIRPAVVSFPASKFPQFEPCFFSPRDFRRTDTQHFQNPVHALEGRNRDGSKGLQAFMEHTEMLPGRVQFPPILSTIHTGKLGELKQEGFDLSSNTSLSNSGPLSKGKWPFSPEYRLSEHRFKLDPWKVVLCLEDTAHTVPHAIIDMVLDAKFPPSKLTVSEVRAILRVMEIRMGFPSYQTHLILPLLVLSYLGPDYARIIQAHHDGNQMILQYSRTVRLDDTSVRTLLGYYCSNLVGVTTPE